MLAWRIVRTKYADSAMNGEGAAEYGGRWNSRGTRMVYASSTMSLAALEILVHRNRMTGLNLVALTLEFSQTLLETLPSKSLPADWNIEPPGQSTMRIGDDFVLRAKQPIMSVPSVLIPTENNLILNPLHPDFSKIKIIKQAPFSLDPRL